MKNPPKNPVLDALPPSLLVRLQQTQRELQAKGVKLYDFGLGDPKEPTPLFIREALKRAVPEVSQYPSPFGSPELRRAAAGYVTRRFGVALDPETQVVAAAGAKETLFHLPLAFMNGKRTKVVYPDPGYPSYEAGTRFAGLTPVPHRLTAKRRFLLEPEDVGEATLKETLLFWVSYPHNPTGATAPRDYYERVVAASKKHGFVVASDECYADIYFGEKPLSILQVSVENCVAIHSCSKRSGMTGYRSGFLAGDADLVALWKKVKSHPGASSPDFVNAAAAAAWADDAHAEERRKVFGKKRERFLRFFAAHGLEAQGSDATLYLWVKVPAGETSLSYAERLLAQGLVVSPGTAFGAGEGYIRLALVPTLEECEKAIEVWGTIR